MQASILVASFLAAAIGLGAQTALADTVVALGASNTFGKGVARSEAYPAQLAEMLRARGRNVRVVNAGINGDTTGGMLRRLDSVTPNDTRVVILQPGGNDARKGVADERSANIAAIKQKLAARGVAVVMMERGMLQGLPHQPDGVHLTPEGYRSLAAYILPEVEAALRR